MLNWMISVVIIYMCMHILTFLHNFLCIYHWMLQPISRYFQWKLSPRTASSLAIYFKTIQCKVRGFSFFLCEFNGLTLGQRSYPICNRFLTNTSSSRPRGRTEYKTFIPTESQGWCKLHNGFLECHITP